MGSIAGSMAAEVGSAIATLHATPPSKLSMFIKECFLGPMMHELV